MGDLGISKGAAHFVCNGGVCPDPKELALEQALFSQVMEHEIALEEAHRLEVEGAFQRGANENLENERLAFRMEVEERYETLETNRKNELLEAENIAIECVRRMPRKPLLQDDFYRDIAPSLIKNGTDKIAIESAFYGIFKHLTGYSPTDFVEPKPEYVNAHAPKEQRGPVFTDPGDIFFNPTPES